MENDIIDFLKEIVKSKFGSLERAMFAINRGEVSSKCPFCGDSKKNSRKKRFYYSLKDNVFFCFNCQIRGYISRLLSDFPNLPNTNYESISKNIGMELVSSFLNNKPVLQEQHSIHPDWKLEFPDGARLDTVLSDNVYLELPKEDKALLLNAIRFLYSRKVKKEWFHYFYFVFDGSPLQDYILTLFEYNEDWVWSGRKFNEQATGPKYRHLTGFPFHSALAFANEVSHAKGKEIYVCESWFSSLILNQENFNSVAVFGLNNMKYNHSALKRFDKEFELIWIPDMDNSFLQFLDNNKSFARKMQILEIPDKDINDTAIRYNGEFKKKFLTFKKTTLFDYDILSKNERII